MLVYRTYLHPKSIINSVLYHNALKYISSNEVVLDTIGTHFQVMNCNGKIYPIYNTCKFDLILFGSKQKAKINVKAEYFEKNWDIKGMEIVTLKES